MHDEKICKIKPEDGTVTKIDTPDLRMGTIPEAWKQPTSYTSYITIDEETSQRRNYGKHLYFFRALNGYGFVAFLSGAVCTAMFPLDNPNDFVCLPLDCCTTADNMGITTFVGDTLYSGGDIYYFPNEWEKNPKNSFYDYVLVKNN